MGPWFERWTRGQEERVEGKESREMRLKATCRGANASPLCPSQWGSIGTQYNEQLTLNLTWKGTKKWVRQYMRRLEKLSVLDTGCTHGSIKAFHRIWGKRQLALFFLPLHFNLSQSDGEKWKKRGGGKTQRKQRRRSKKNFVDKGTRKWKERVTRWRINDSLQSYSFLQERICIETGRSVI